MQLFTDDRPVVYVDRRTHKQLETRLLVESFLDVDPPLFARSFWRLAADAAPRPAAPDDEILIDDEAPPILIVDIPLDRVRPYRVVSTAFPRRIFAVPAAIVRRYRMRHLSGWDVWRLMANANASRRRSPDANELADGPDLEERRAYERARRAYL